MEHFATRKFYIIKTMAQSIANYGGKFLGVPCSIWMHVTKLQVTHLHSVSFWVYPVLCAIPLSSVKWQWMDIVEDLQQNSWAVVTVFPVVLAKVKTISAYTRFPYGRNVNLASYFTSVQFQLPCNQKAWQPLVLFFFHLGPTLRYIIYGNKCIFPMLPSVWWKLSSYQVPKPLPLLKILFKKTENLFSYITNKLSLPVFPRAFCFLDHLFGRS